MNKRTETHACDLISRQEAIEALKMVPGVGNRVLDKLRQLPSAQKTGRWINSTTDESVCEEWACSLCGMFSLKESNFCPNCGAKMGVEE